MSQGQESSTDGAGPLYITGAFILVVFIVHIVWGDAIIGAWLRVRYVWAWLFVKVWPGSLPNVQESMYWMRAYYPQEWDASRIALLGRQLRLFMWPVIALPIGYFAYRVWAKNPGVKLRRSMNMSSLAESESRVWPWLKPVLGKKIIDHPIDKGPWAMGLSPLEFARKFDLLDGQVVNRDRAEKLFASQLGSLWESPDRLRRSTRALFACFCAQACGNGKVAVRGLETLALTMPSGSPDYGFVQGLLDEHYKDPRIQAVLQKHAYASTVISAMLLEARKHGVLPPSFFIWLRPSNRALWYTLNGVGRSTPFSEASGVHAHRLAEQVAGHGIELAYVVKCVDALEKAIREVEHG